MLCVTVREQNCAALVPWGYRTTFCDRAELIYAPSEQGVPGMDLCPYTDLDTAFPGKPFQPHRGEKSHCKVWTCLELVPAGKQDSGAFFQMHYFSDSKENMSVLWHQDWGCSEPADSCAGDAIPSSVTAVLAVYHSEGSSCNQILA